MVTFTTTAATRVWQPHGDADYAAIGVATIVDVAAALLMVNIIWKANWPPYTAAMPQLVVYGAAGAILATVGVSFRYGMWGEETQELGCTVAACLLWLGLGSLFSAAFLRVYHYHDVLVSKNGNMWPILCQVPFILPPAFLATPGLGGFDTTSCECQSNSAVPEMFAFGAMALLALSSLVMTYRMRFARVQAPYEFEAAVIITVVLSIAAIALPWAHVEMEGRRPHRRVGMLFLTALTTLGVVAAPIFRHLSNYLINEDKLKNSGEFCFGQWRSKKRTQYLRLQYRRFQEVANSPAGYRIKGYGAITQFFRDISARETIKSYPQAQASTMRILDMYFKVGLSTSVAVPISEGCRKSTLTFRASSAYIFDRARDEILEKMGIEKIPRLEEDGCPTTVRSHSRATSGSSSIGVSNLDKVEAGTASSIANTAPKVPTSSSASSTTSSPLHLGGYGGATEFQTAPGVELLQAPPVQIPGASRRSAKVVRAANAPETPMTPPLDYRGEGRKKSKAKEDAKEAGDEVSVGGGRRRLKKSPLLSLFGRLGGGGGKPEALDGSSSDSSPFIVHMDEDDDTDFDGDGGGDHEAGRRVAAVGRALGGIKPDVRGLRGLAGVKDLDAAFGLARAKDEDEDDEISQYRSTGFIAGGGGGGKKKKKPRAAGSFVASGIAGYGSVLSSMSSISDDSDLTDPRPLSGDTSKSPQRKNTRGSASADAAAARASSSGIPKNSKRLVLREESRDLQEGGRDEGEVAAPEPPLPGIKIANPLYKSGGGEGAGSKVRAMVRDFDVEAQAQAVSAGLAVDNDQIGPANVAGKKKKGGRKGKKKGGKGGGGGGGGGAGGGGAGSPGSPAQLEVFTIAEAGEDEDEEAAQTV